jgi:hypothetical protein
LFFHLPRKGCSPANAESNGAWAVLGVGYCAERDPNGECSHLGLGKHWHLFSDSARPAFARAPSAEAAPILVDRNVKYVDGSCDSFGNPPPEGEGGEAGVVESGPYAGQFKGAGSRFDYFLPEVPVGAVLEPAEADTPLWLRQLCEGRPLERD